MNRRAINVNVGFGRPHRFHRALGDVSRQVNRNGIDQAYSCLVEIRVYLPDTRGILSV